MISREWGLPPQFENGLVAQDLLASRYGHRLHLRDLCGRRHMQTIDIGANHQMALEVRPAHDPTKDYGFLGVTVETTNLEGSIRTWWRGQGTFYARNIVTIPPEPADAAKLPALLKPFGAFPRLVTDIDLSLEDRHLYIARWGIGELHEYDVNNPFSPRLAGSIRLGRVAKYIPHPCGAP